jgi:hypothetical protein
VPSHPLAHDQPSVDIRNSTLHVTAAPVGEPGAQSRNDSYKLIADHGFLGNGHGSILRRVRIRSLRTKGP